MSVINIIIDYCCLPGLHITALSWDVNNANTADLRDNYAPVKMSPGKEWCCLGECPSSIYVTWSILGISRSTESVLVGILAPDWQVAPLPPGWLRNSDGEMVCLSESSPCHELLLSGSPPKRFIFLPFVMSEWCQSDIRKNCCCQSLPVIILWAAWGAPRQDSLWQVH